MLPCNIRIIRWSCSMSIHPFIILIISPSVIITFFRFWFGLCFCSCSSALIILGIVNGYVDGIITLVVLIIRGNTGKTRMTESTRTDNTPMKITIFLSFIFLFPQSCCKLVLKLININFQKNWIINWN